MSKGTLKPVQPNPARWEPSADPDTIHVPGLDNAASVNDQIDQIEQLITLKLQNIDANFSKIQHLMSTRLLPAIKRYAVSTEPVREAAKFWTSFYEHTAQVRIPIYEDYSSFQENPDDAETESAQGYHPSSQSETGMASTTTENSFMPGQAAFSSTPAVSSRHGDFSAQQSVGQPSWSDTIESPLVRLDREIRSLSEDDSDARTTTLPDPMHQNSKGKGRVHGPPEALLRNVLKQQASAQKAKTGDFSPSPRKRIPYIRNGVSPLKLKPKPKTPVVNKSQNPYLPANSQPNDWNGVVDLSDPSMTPSRQKSLPFKRTPRPAQTPQGDGLEDSMDDSSIDIIPGMSPPVTMQLARAPRSSVGLGLIPKLGRTPKSSAAERIRKDLIADLQRGSGSRYGGSGMKSNASRHAPVVESSTSTIPSPPSLSRYARHGYPTQDSDTTDSVAMDTSLESMMRRVGLSHVTGSGSSRLASEDVHTPNYQDVHDSDSSSDSLDEHREPGQPSAAFIMASQNQGGIDDSFCSTNSSDSFDDDQQGEGAPVQPFAQVEEDDAFEDDSFEDDLDQGGVEEETLFGVPPHQRVQNIGGSGLRLHGEDLLQDTIGLGQHRVDESPTPWASQRGPTI